MGRIIGIFSRIDLQLTFFKGQSLQRDGIQSDRRFRNSGNVLLRCPEEKNQEKKCDGTHAQPLLNRNLNAEHSDSFSLMKKKGEPKSAFFLLSRN
jgi:hypothetical protein